MNDALPVPADPQLSGALLAPSGPRCHHLSVTLDPRRRRSMRKWRREAAPILGALVRSEDLLLDAIVRPGVTVLAAVDQLEFACDEAEEWLYHHPCPDGDFGQVMVALIRACAGMCPVMHLVADDAPDGLRTADGELMSKVDAGLTDRISIAVQSRAHLRRLGCQ